MATLKTKMRPLYESKTFFSPFSNTYEFFRRLQIRLRKDGAVNQRVQQNVTGKSVQLPLNTKLFTLRTWKKQFDEGLR